MIDRVIVCALFLAMFYKPAVSQDIIYVDTTFGVFVPKTVFGSIDLGQCLDSYVDEELNFQFSYDILVRQDGKIFGFGKLNGFPDTVFFIVTPLSPNTVISFPLAITYNHEIRSLTCDENGYAYAAGRGITQTKIECCDHDETYLGDLPPDMQCLGDITYRKGKFYLSAIGNKLVEVNMKDISKSQIVMEFPLGTLPIHGLTTVQLGCDSVATYAIGRAWNHSVVYEINFNNWSLTQVCDMPLLAVDGAGNQTECALPPCGVFVDLDDDNSSFGFWGNHCVDTFCLSPVTISDTDVVILSDPGYLDSVTFELEGILDTGDESLTAGATANVTVTGNNTAYLILADNGATVEDFEDAIKTVLYHNTAAMASPGKRKVLVTGWANGESSPVSVAELPLFNTAIQLQADITEPDCHGGSDGVIAVSVIGGSLPYTYQWGNGASGNFLDNLQAGDYPLIVFDSTGCGTFTTFTIGEPDLIVAEATGTNVLCVGQSSGTASVTATGGSGTYTYDWSNGKTAPTINQLFPGWYYVTVTDVNQCSDTASVFISSPPVLNVAIEATEVLCFGEEDGTAAALANGGTPPYTFEWNGGQTDSLLTGLPPGSYSVTVTDANDCTQAAQVQIESSTQIQVLFQITPATGAANADGGVQVNLIFGGMPPYTYQWSNGTTEQSLQNVLPGQYSLMVTDANGCQNVFYFTVDVGDAVGEKQSVPFQVVIVPNPSGSIGAELWLEATQPQMLAVQVFDGLGQSLFSKKVFAQMGESHQDLPQGLPPGMYWVVVKNGDGTARVLKWVVM